MHSNGGRLLALQLPLGGQAGQRLTHGSFIAELFGGSFPTQLLGRRQPTQIEHMPLSHPAVDAPPVLNQTPVRMRFAVFAPLMASQEDCHERGSYQLLPRLEETRSALHGVLESLSSDFPGNRWIYTAKILKNGVELRKSG
jgi:hypothetical protein